jgi:hypothetical protein
VLLLTSGWLPTVVLPGLDVVDVGPMSRAAEVADFAVRRLHAHVGSSHALLMRWDAGVLNTAAWTDEFLVHDHVAAPDDPGLGGGLPALSLRSRRLMRAGADPRLGDGLLDDAALLGRLRPFLEQAHGVSVAPAALARRLAASGARAEPWQFGFAGAGFLPAQRDEADMIEVVRRLPGEFLDSADASRLLEALQEQAMPEAATLLQQCRATEQARAQVLQAAVR